ncbi:PREDICTED: C3a anaphylatoxin chemotactic receptor-like [Nanorana parkeri]|uniref:C3a anaphylatoxin chemotactic receptor-like n=1 Tax=Nanorana parkeri TaxID=125878 RepID=UPI000854E861|nr:PREDICTED: C3a anaphylatoxin chemotactic receptor-like [Nanorana parkeri]
MMNVTEDSESNTHHFSQQVLTTIVMTVTFLVGVPGNMMVIWITCWKMKRTVNTIWFWNLAMADVTCCLFIPLSIVQLFHGEWLYGPALCKILPVIVHLTMFASVFTLVAISIDRCLLVVQPVWAQNKRSLRMAWALCVVIWMLSFLMCLPAVLHRKTILYDNITFCLYIYDEDYDDDAIDHSLSHNSTDEDYQIPPLDITITFTRMIFGFLIPLLIVSSSYILLASKVQSSRLFKVGRKTTKVVLCIVVAFFVTWAPYHIIGVIMLYFSNTIVETLNSLSVALVYLNSCINPILYVFMGKDMKKRVQQSVRMLMQNAFSEEVSRSTERTRSKLTTEDSMAF